MPDQLTERERALIDEFPDHRIIRVPRGVTAEPRYVWVAGPNNRKTGNIVADRPHNAKEIVKAQHRVRIRGQRFAALKRREAAQ
jgi:hypothetical protein